MKTKGNGSSINTAIIGFTIFLLVLSFRPLSPVYANIFICNTAEMIQDTLEIAERNGENDAIIVLPGEYNIDREFTYTLGGDENYRLYILGLPWDKPVLNGMNSSTHMYLDTLDLRGDSGSDANADIWISDIVFLNGTEDRLHASGGPLRIFTYQADIRLKNCLFQNNYTSNGLGAGAHLSTGQHGNIIVENCVFQNNTIEWGAGGGLGIAIYELCDVHMVNNTFINNSAELVGGGAAIRVEEVSEPWATGTLNVSNNIFWDNSVGVYGDVSLFDPDALMELNIQNNIIADFHDFHRYSIPLGSANWDIDPMLNPDFTLDRISPCIDSGQNNPGSFRLSGKDFLDQRRIMDGDANGIAVVDIGATEYQPPGAKSGSPRPYHFLPDIPAEMGEIIIPEGPPYYLMVGEIAQNSDQKVGWSVSIDRNVSSVFSLYYGDPASGNYNTDQSRNSGSFNITNVDLKGLQDPKLSFMLYMDTEAGNQKDTLKVWADDKLIWEKDKDNVDMKKWQMIEIGLEEFAGETIALKVEFDTRDSENNHTEGVYIDEFLVQESLF